MKLKFFAHTIRMKETKAKKPFLQKLFFWLFVVFVAMGVFLLWSLRDVNFGDDGGDIYALIAAVGAICLGILFGCLGFIKYLRNKTVAGGLFLTTALSTAVFLGASQLVGLILAPAAMATAAEPGIDGDVGINFVVILAQVGLFALWFAFLLFSIRVALNPLRKINSSLDNIMEGREVHRLRLGKSRQYKEIEQKLITISQKQRRKQKK